MRRVLILLIFLLSSSVYANFFEKEENLANIVEQMPMLKSVECKFRQERYIPQSGILLKSSGDFKFEEGKGVTFYTTYPIKTVSSYTSKEYKRINVIIEAISKKSFGKLEKDFKFYFERNNNIWNFGLAPKSDSQIVDYIETIKISGDSSNSLRAISNMEIKLKDGTTTNIWWE